MKNMKEKQLSLRRKIRRFNKMKVWVAPPIILTGLAGVLLPVIPGWPLVAAGVSLIVPQTRNLRRNTK